MAKSIAKSCPLCLSVNDPADMLDVMMPHSTPPQSAPMYLCRLCVLEVMKAAFRSDLIDPREVFPDAPVSSSTDRPADSGPAPDPAVAAVVLQDQRAEDNLTVDRREPEVPAGGEGSCERCGKDFPNDDLSEWEGPNAPAMKVCAPCAQELDIEL